MATFKRDFNFNENIMFNIFKNIEKIADLSQGKLILDVL